MPQGAFYVFADASKWTEDSYSLAFEFLENAGVDVAPGVDGGQMGKRAVRLRVNIPLYFPPVPVTGKRKRSVASTGFRWNFSKKSLTASS